jgi:hypothetical protein
LTDRTAFVISPVVPFTEFGIGLASAEIGVTAGPHDGSLARRLTGRAPASPWPGGPGTMARMLAPGLLAIDREKAMIAAFAMLAVAGIVVSIGAWILLFRERRLRSGRRL